MKMKKMLALGLAAAMVFSMTACGDSEATSSAAAETGSAAGSAAAETGSVVDTADAAAAAGIVSANQDPLNTTASDEAITIGLASEPDSLFPTASGKTTSEDMMISRALSDTLVTTDKATNEVVGCLATDWTWDDETHCTFTLRDGVQMSDGTDLVADDVVYCVNEIWIPLNAGTDTGKFLVGAEAKDDKTVTIEFNTVAPDLLSMLAWSNFIIVSKDEVEAAGGLEAMEKAPAAGCGKYKFVEWKSGQSITLERNDNYWNTEDVPYFKTITLTFTSDAASREMAVESGDAQVAYDMPVSQAATYVGNDAVQVMMTTFGQNSHLWYNMTDGHATNDANVRKAIDLALDFDAIAQVGTAGYGQPALGYFTTDTAIYSETYTTEERAQDIEQAKQLLSDAGYADGLELTTVGLQDTTALYTVIQACLQQVGITLTINTVDTAQFVQDAFGGNYDLIVVGELTDVRYPTLFCFLDKETIASGFVIGGPKSTTDEIDGLITEIVQASDTDTAKEKAAELEGILKDQTIVSNLFPEMKASIYAKDLKGYRTIERGYMDITSFYK